MEILELLLTNGWRVEPARHTQRRGACAVTLCLHLDDQQVVCQHGAGPTIPVAVIDAAVRAADWVRTRARSHPLFAAYPAHRRLLEG